MADALPNTFINAWLHAGCKVAGIWRARSPRTIRHRNPAHLRVVVALAGSLRLETVDGTLVVAAGEMALLGPGMVARSPPSPGADLLILLIRALVPEPRPDPWRLLDLPLVVPAGAAAELTAFADCCSVAGWPDDQTALAARLAVEAWLLATLTHAHAAGRLGWRAELPDELSAVLREGQRRSVDPSFDAEALCRLSPWGRWQLGAVLRAHGFDPPAALLRRWRVARALDIVHLDPATPAAEIASRAGFTGVRALQRALRSVEGATLRGRRQRQMEICDMSLLPPDMSHR